jgi:hypothetical protein
MADGDLADVLQVAPDLHPDRPRPARVYDYLLGGKDNFAADRAAAEQGLRANPHSRIPPRENRAFLRRVVRFLAGEAGIRQFLDIGTGIPTSPNVHEVAQAVAPEARIVYVDNDPMVLAHARALLTSTAAGRIVDRLLAALPSGSYLALSHLTGDFDPAAWDGVAAVYRKSGVTLQVRSRADIERFFTGLDMVEPGVQVLPAWRPDADAGEPPTDVQVSVYGGLARKP